MPPVKTTLRSVPPVMAPLLILSRFLKRPQLLTRVSALLWAYTSRQFLLPKGARDSSWCGLQVVTYSQS
jgi:hypothetical protein